MLAFFSCCCCNSENLDFLSKAKVFEKRRNKWKTSNKNVSVVVSIACFFLLYTEVNKIDLLSFRLSKKKTNSNISFFVAFLVFIRNIICDVDRKYESISCFVLIWFPMENLFVHCEFYKSCRFFFFINAIYV